MHIFRYDLLSIIVFILIIVAVILFPVIPIIRKVPYGTCVDAVCDRSTLYLTFRTLPQIIKNQNNPDAALYRLFDINR